MCNARSKPSIQLITGLQDRSIHGTRGSTAGIAVNQTHRCRLCRTTAKRHRTAARSETTRDATTNPQKMKSPPAAPAAGAYSAVSRKLMASMGWSEGKGLGKHEQGADKHIEHKKRGEEATKEMMGRRKARSEKQDERENYTARKNHA